MICQKGQGTWAPRDSKDQREMKRWVTHAAVTARQGSGKSSATKCSPASRRQQKAQTTGSFAVAWTDRTHWMPLACKEDATFHIHAYRPPPTCTTIEPDISLDVLSPSFLPVPHHCPPFLHIYPRFPQCFLRCV